MEHNKPGYLEQFVDYICRTIKYKLIAILMVAITLPVVFIEKDATATVFMALIALPLFIVSDKWIEEKD